MRANVENPTRARQKALTWSKHHSNSDDRDVATEISAESANSVLAPEVSRVSSTPSMASTHHRDVEELLWARSQAVAAPEVDFDALSNLSLDTWEPRAVKRKHKRHDGFHTYSRQVITPNIPATTEVLVTGELQCSLAEAAALLCCQRAGDFTATMTNLHGRSFQRGSVVHNFRAENQEAQGDFLPPYRCVKTASFAHPRLALFDTDERWCFLENFVPVAKTSTDVQDGFTLSQRSLRPSALPRAVRPPIELVRRSHGLCFTRSKKHTHQLLGLSLSYFVEVISGHQPAAVRVVFYSSCSPVENEDSNVVLRRMKLLARSVLKLPDMVRRRRISAQIPADAWSISRLASKHPESPAFSHCVSCSRKFHKLLMIKKTRCYLCAHFVCSRCWVRQPLETANGRKIAVLVCPHCLGSIQHCNYSHIAASYVSGRGSGSSASTSSRVSMFGGGASGEHVYRAAHVLPDTDDAPEPGAAVISYLAEIFREEIDADSSSESDSFAESSARVQTAANVLGELTSVLDEGVNRVMAHCFWTSDNDAKLTPELEPGIVSTLQRLQAQFKREVLPLEACSLSNAATRTYPIDTSSEGSEATVPVGPIPPNEVHRLDAITEEQLVAAKGSDELGLMCELATQELSCMASLVTIVGRTLQYVLATDFQPLQNAELPRNHTLCQHLLMGDRPMIVQHPEADVRFCNLSLVVDFGIQFYAGFPIFSRDGLSVGVASDDCKSGTNDNFFTLPKLKLINGNDINLQPKKIKTSLALTYKHENGTIKL
ncbi:unnamed protein product [Phytophthora lilii]|uniref:Unnamed protein product n=1 Tax=Phytophthora lilii TaxID=2077276 RepID=A0A9W6U9I9_9STRA|nr:unnamed protein product [Phytophthora lilii]